MADGIQLQPTRCAKPFPTDLYLVDRSNELYTYKSLLVGVGIAIDHLIQIQRVANIVAFQPLPIKPMGEV